MVSPEALYAALRRTGAAAWFDFGRTTVLLALDDEAAAALPLGGGPTAWVDRTRAACAASIARAGALDAEPETRRTLAERLWGGTFGWFSYEAGAWFVRTPAPCADLALPAAWLARATAVAVHEGGAWQLVTESGTLHRAGPVGFDPGRLDGADAHGRLIDAWHSAECHGLPPLAQGAARIADTTTEAAYIAGVRAIQAHLRAGDCYQVNLARRVTLASPGTPLGAWRRLRALNPARRGALVETRHGAVVSNSPELLLQAERGRAVSVPIKGTGARTGGTHTRRVLLESQKERAELRMIVDLVRADFARVARAGSIRTGPRRIGAVGHLWHAMQRVRCELEAPRDAVDAFRAVFPAGSVTGAPRMRAMEVIRALETVPRGVYCGSIGGFYDSDGAGRFDAGHWNVAIRTLSFPAASPEAYLHVGAGIVLGSDPASEWAETALKAERLLQAVA